MDWEILYKNLEKSMKRDPFLAQYTKQFIMDCLSITDKQDIERLRRIRAIKINGKI